MNPRLPFVTLLIAAASVLIHLSPAATDALQFDRAALAAGEGWRWLTAHLTHFDSNHLGWDVAILVMLGTWCETQSRGRTGLALALAAVAIPAAVAGWQPQFQLYRGLSGLDCALFGLGAASLLRAQERVPVIAGAVALVGFAAKCALEIATGSTVFASGANYAPVPLAHIVGLGAGVIAASASERSVSTRWRAQLRLLTSRRQTRG